MVDKSSKIVAKTLLHCTVVTDKSANRDAVIVSEIVENEKGETWPELTPIYSPNVKFWVTSDPYRTHSDKKEFEKTQCLDEYQVPHVDREREMFKAVRGYYPNHMTPQMRREIYQSPYLYGANIMLEARVAMAYKKNLLKAGRTPHQPTTGFFDIEMSLLPESQGKLPLMVFTAENKVYLAMKRSFMYEPRGGERVKVTAEEVMAAAHEHLDPLVESIFAANDDLKDYRHKLPFEYTLFEADTEVEMIKWIFDKMHESKVSFIGIWNLGFDIGEIIRILEEGDVPLKSVFADPSLRDSNYGYAHYREDPRVVQHFTQKWHWVTSTSHFQFIDSMALYSYIRVVDGKEASYALDDILKKFNLGGKLKVGQTEELQSMQTPDWHRAMLSKHFVNYAIYAMWDAMALQLLEWNNNDLTAMMLLGDITPPKYFVNQTIRVTNTLFEEWLAKNQILGTGIDVESVRDNELLNAGGAVLQPENLIGPGVRLFKEWPNHPTRCFAWLNDVDFSGQYPNACWALNISKQTKLATVLNISASHLKIKYDVKKEGSPEQQAIEIFFSYLATPNSNGRELGVEFFDLPDYQEMNELFKERIHQLA